MCTNADRRTIHSGCCVLAVLLEDRLTFWMVYIFIRYICQIYTSNMPVSIQTDICFSVPGVMLPVDNGLGFSLTGFTSSLII